MDAFGPAHSSGMMRALLWTTAGLLAAAVVLAAVLRLDLRPRAEPAAPSPRREEDTVEPLRAPSEPPREAPEGAVVRNAADAVRVRAAFRLQPDAAAPGGAILVLPEGAGTDARAGRAELEVEIPAAGRYHAWARVRWRDACGNSVSLRVDDGPHRSVGGDDVFNVWHWVKAGECSLATGAHRVTLLEREDGVALAQLLLTRDPLYRPSGPIRTGAVARGIRRFGDRFDRSPGHGLGRWEVVSGQWEHTFSLDPNRIPNQYSLVGKATGGRALALVEGPPWVGCRLAFSVRPLGPGRFGCVVDRAGERELPVLIELEEAGARLRVGARPPTELGDRVRPGQWHRIEVERWAWRLRVAVDGEAVFEASDLAARSGRPGLIVAAGAAVFDDVDVDEVPWTADDGGTLRIAWRPAEGARWYRRRSDGVLVGKAGSITSPDIGLPICDRLLQGDGISAETVESGRAVRFFASEDPAWIDRVALAYGGRRTEPFRIGPYHFTERRIEDPSDYLDFTDEEWRKIQQSPDRDKLRRRKKYVPLVGAGAHCIWSRRAGRWRLRDGELWGRGPDASLRYAQEIVSDLEVRLRVRLAREAGAAELLLYDAERAVRVRLSRGEERAEMRNGCRLRVPDGAWHRLRVAVRGRTLEAALDDGTATCATVIRGDGGGVLLTVPDGSAGFDDIEFAVPRRSARGVFSTFDRRETGWWREGGRWMDHGGMACVLASHWVSLIAPEGGGALWHKRPFGSDVLVAFNIEENSEWFGWSQRPSHAHYPYDNVRVVLGMEPDVESGYRLELNSRDRTATVLYRNDKEVASVAQDADFPIRYVGGHAPYRPRKNRITLVKRGWLLRAMVNGEEVLRYEDPQPLPVRRVGIGGYRTRVNFSHIELRSLEPTDERAKR
jgi:hypothetical protein